MPRARPRRLSSGRCPRHPDRAHPAPIPLGLQERRLVGYDCVALVHDGKAFADDVMVSALGITVRGEKVLLGFVQTGTENATTCAVFLRSLLDRGLRVAEGLLVVLDGGKGLRRAVREVFGEQARVQRCVWHKRENVVAYLPKPLQPLWRAKLQRAHRQPTYAAAQADLQRLHGELRRLSEDAARSLAEGLEETLTLHRLGLVDRLGGEPVHHERAGVHPGPGRAASGQSRSLDDQ